MSQAGLSFPTAEASVENLPQRAGKAVGRFWSRYPAASVALVVLAVVLVATLFANFVAPFDPYERQGVRFAEPFSPSKDGRIHILGTDRITRDLFSRLLHGGKVSLIVGLVAPTLGITVGALFGITGAYFGGVTDLIIQRLTDTLMAIPSIILAMAIIIPFELEGELNLIFFDIDLAVFLVIIALSIAISPYASRLLRSHALVLRNMQYVEAARAVGSSNMRIIMRHLVPNSWAPWIVMLAVNVGNAIVIEASLSYLGVGISPPTPSWGNLLTGAANYFADNPHLVYAPGLMITVVVLCSNIFGDALRDMLDPRLRGAD